MKIFDTHTHDYFRDFDVDRDQMIQENFTAGVVGKIQIGCDEKTSEQAVALAKKYDNMWATIGIHPCSVEENFTNIESIFEGFQELRNANIKKIVGVGETGFDCYHNDSPQMREQQKVSFTKHLQFGIQNNLPVIVHTRNAQKITLESFRENKNIIGKGVIHCFSEDAPFAKIMTEEYGYFLGIGGVSTYPAAKGVREAIKQTPIEFLVTETDSPYLAPQSVRGTRNTSQNIREIIELISQIKGIKEESCADILLKNAERLFNL